jgi:hypothetical protein
MYNCFVIVIVVAISITIGGVLAVIIKGRNSRTVCRLELVNQGNVRSRYDLQTQDPSGELRFRFTLDGAALPQRAVAAAGKVDQAAMMTGGTAGGSSFAGGIANLLYSLGYLLPSSLGRPLIEAGSRLRQGQYAAGQVEQTRDRARRLTNDSTASAGQAAALPPTGTWVQTPDIEPGQPCTLELFIDPLRFHTQPTSYPFKIRSRSVELADAAWTTDEWTVQVDSLSSLSRNTPLLIVLGLAMVGLILAAAICVNSTGIIR